MTDSRDPAYVAPKKEGKEWAELIDAKFKELHELIIDSVQNGRANTVSAEPADFLQLQCIYEDLAFHLLEAAHDATQDRMAQTGSVTSITRLSIPRRVKGGVVNL